MRRLLAVSLAVVVVVSAVGLGATVTAALPGDATGLAGPAVSTQETTTDGADNGSGAVAPGERLAGVVSVSEAELSTEIETRAFAASFANASTNGSRAAVLARQVETARERLTELRRERQRLVEARENGTVSEGRYRARTAILTAQIRSVQRLLNQTATVADRVPAADLERKGVNPAAIQELRTDAAELTGPGASEIARGIAGKGAGNAIGPPDDERGPPGDDERGPPGDDERGPPDEGERGPPGDDGQGPPGDDEAGQSGTDAGPPGDDRGPPDDADTENGTATGNETASGDGTSNDRGSEPDDSGKGNEGGNDDAGGNGEGSQASDSEDGGDGTSG